MKSNTIKFSIILLACIIAIDTVSANPGINVAVAPISSTVKQGETVQFSVTVTAMPDIESEVIIVLEVIGSDGNPVSWPTRFSSDSFILGPYSTNPEKTVTLDMDIPPGTTVGNYIQNVRGKVYLPDFTELGSVDSSAFPITVVVTEIPEFPTIVIPVISIIGLMLLFQRR